LNVFDSDGYVLSTRKEIYFGSVSPELVKDFQLGLKILKIKSKLYVQKRKGYLDFYKIRLSGSAVDEFISRVKPSQLPTGAELRGIEPTKE
jgi:intein/homing endonuclease